MIMREIFLKSVYLFLLVVGGVAGISQTTITIPVSLPEQLRTNTSPDTTICVQRSVQLNSTTTGGSPGYLYLWSPAAGLDNPNIPNPIASPDTTTTYTFTVIDNNNCIVLKDITIVIDPCTGIDEPENNLKFELFPNPNTGKFFIESGNIYSSNVNVRIFNIYGQLIWEKTYFPKALSNIEIDIGDYPGGIYILQLENNNEILTKRFQVL